MTHKNQKLMSDLFRSLQKNFSKIKKRRNEDIAHLREAKVNIQVRKEKNRRNNIGTRVKWLSRRLLEICCSFKFMKLI